MEKSFMLIFSVIILCFAFCTFVFAEDTDFCTEHKLTYTQVEPTCTDAGFLYAKCENCSYEKKTSIKKLKKRKNILSYIEKGAEYIQLCTLIFI